MQVGTSFSTPSVQSALPKRLRKGLLKDQFERRLLRLALPHTMCSLSGKKILAFEGRKDVPFLREQLQSHMIH